MAIGPVQLLVEGFSHPQFQEEGFEVGAERGASAVEERGGVFSEETAPHVLVLVTSKGDAL